MRGLAIAGARAYRPGMTDLRRNACPSLAVPMRTGDGFLARLPPLAQALTGEQLGAIAAAARAHGNGLVEISKRGNLQLRGLASPDTAELSADLADAGLDLSEGLPVSSDPLAALVEGAPDAAPIVAALHARLAQSGIGARLAPKVALVVDLGTPTAPAGVAADLRLAFRGADVHLGLGGTHASARWIGTVPAEEAVTAALAILGTLARLPPDARLAGSSGRRDADAAIAAAVETLRPAAKPLAPPPIAAIGPIAGLGTAAGGIMLTFGQAEAAALATLVRRAISAGIIRFAPAPDRTLLFAGTETAVAATLAAAAELGFITDPADPRRFVSACIGSAGCASGHFPARAVAAASVGALDGLLDGSLDIHFSGCAKGCAHPEPADVTLSGIDKGAGLVLDGRARDTAIGFALPEMLVEQLALVGARRAAGETARAALDRIGQAGIVEAITGGIAAEHGGERGSSGGERLSA